MGHLSKSYGVCFFCLKLEKNSLIFTYEKHTKACMTLTFDL